MFRGQPQVHRGPLVGPQTEPVEPSEAVRSGPDPRVTLPPGLAADAEAFLLKDDLPPEHPLYGKQGHLGLNRQSARIVGRRGV